MSENISRIERWIWYVFLVTAAWQTRGIVWHADAVFVEWRSLVLYASDVCMCALFVCSLIALYRRPIRVSMTEQWVLASLVVSAILSLAYAISLVVGVIQVVRLIQFILFFLYLRYRAWVIFDSEKTALAFILGAFLQAGLGIGQFLAQHDLGLRWIGETLLRVDMRGVAVFYDLMGQKVLRAYGTLPHPNILAAYLMLAIWLIAWLWTRHLQKGFLRRVMWHGVLGVLLVGQYLTFSRTILAVELLALLVFGWMVYFWHGSAHWENIVEIRARLRMLFGTFLVVTSIFCILLWGLIEARMTISSSDEAVRLRVRYNNEAIVSGAKNPIHINLIGVGIGNFTSWLARYDRTLPSFLIQPAHNVYLMIYSEMGIVGLTLWLVVLGLVARMLWTGYRHEPLLRAGLCILGVSMLAIGLLDHFYWTLQQGRLLWWATLALAAGRA